MLRRLLTISTCQRTDISNQVLAWLILSDKINPGRKEEKQIGARLRTTKWLEGGGQSMTDTTENPYVLYSLYEEYLLKLYQSSESASVAPIVQYHTKGEFQPVVPVVPIVSSSQAYQPEETESEIFHPTVVGEPLHETTEIVKGVEEAYIPPVQTNVEKEQVVQYSAWDASRSVILRPLKFYHNC
jgi:hypothetical protein